MFTFNRNKIQRRFKFLIFFLSMAVLAGCKPSIDYLDVLVTKAGEQIGEGDSKSIDGQGITLEAINPGDKLYLDVITGDDKSAHIPNHKFRWKVLEGDIGEWQINGTEAGELGENFWDAYSDKTIELRAPDGADSQITLEVTVTCEEVEGSDSDKSTALRINIDSKRSIDEIHQKISRLREKINKNLDDEKRSLIKAGSGKRRLLAEVIHRVTDDFLLEKETNLIDADAKHQYARGLLEKTEKHNFTQDIMSKVAAAADHQTCVSTQPKDYVHFDEKYDQQEKYHESVCDQGMKLKELCILEVADRGTGDSVVLSCNPDEDNSSAQNFSSKAGDSRGDFVPYLEQHKYFVTYRLTEDETYTVIGNVKDFPSILGDEMPATQINCDLIKWLPFCIKNIAQDDIEDVRLMLKKLLEKKHPIACGGKNQKGCKNQISTLTNLGKRNQPNDGLENTNNQQNGHKKQKILSNAESKTKQMSSLQEEEDRESNAYCRTPQKVDEEIGAPPEKKSEKEFINENRKLGRKVICWSFQLKPYADWVYDIEGLHIRNGIEHEGYSYAIDCDAYNKNEELRINSNECHGNDSQNFVTFFVALRSNGHEKPIYSFSNYYANADKLYKHIETGYMGNVSEATIKNRSVMFDGATNLKEVSIDTADTVNMIGMFQNARKFNDNINGWDVSKVTDMSYMFNGASIFNKPLDGWDVSSVESMQGMFQSAKKFNQNINSWIVSKVSDMAGMFRGASVFNMPLNSWDVSSVESMKSMFQSAKKFNQNINSWIVSKVSDMSFMFDNASEFNKPLNGWDVSRVESMQGMFQSAINFNQDINNWIVSKVSDMSYMFNGASEFNKPIGDWNVQKVKDMSYMFSGASKFNKSIRDWLPYKLMSTGHMFDGAIAFNQNISTWDTRARWHSRYTGMYENCGIDENNKFRSARMRSDK